MMRSLFCFIMAVGSVLPAAGHGAMSSALENPKATQPDMATLQKLRPKYSRDADALIASSQVIAIHYSTIAAANNYWRGAKERDEQ